MRMPDLFWNELKRAILLATCLIGLAASARDYPYYIPDDDWVREKFDIWAADFGFRDEEGIFEDAFLLNCSPDSVDEKRALFRISRIEQDEYGDWIVTVCNSETGDEFWDGGEYANGYVRIEEVSLAGVDNENARFFRARLTVLPDDW